MHDTKYPLNQSEMLLFKLLYFPLTNRTQPLHIMSTTHNWL